MAEVVQHIAELISAFIGDETAEKVRLALEAHVNGPAVQTFCQPSSNDLNRVMFVGIRRSETPTAIALHCTVGAPGPAPPDVAILRVCDNIDVSKPLTNQIVQIPLLASGVSSGQRLPIMTLLEALLRHAFGPALRAELSAVAGSADVDVAVSPAVQARLLDTEKRVAELASLMGQVRAAASSSLPRVRLASEPSLEAAAAQCMKDGRALTLEECGLAGTVESLAPRLEAVLQRWISSIRSLSSLIQEKDEADVREAGQPDVEAAGDGDAQGGSSIGGAVRKPKRVIGGSSALADPCPGGPWSTAPSLPTVVLEDEVTWWGSAAEVLADLQAQISTGHVVRLTLQALRVAKKRFAVSAFEAEAETVAALSARVASVTCVARSFPVHAIRAAQDTTALAQSILQVADHIGRTLTAGGGAQGTDVLRCQRLLWAAGDAAAASAERILRKLCQDAAAQDSGPSSSTSLLHLPLDVTSAISHAWAEVEEAWRQGCEAIRHTVDSLDKKAKQAADKPSVGLKPKANTPAGPPRMRLNPILLRLGDRVRVALSFRSNHATFADLVDASLAATAWDRKLRPMQRLHGDLQHVKSGLESAWATAVSTAGDPLDVQDARAGAMDSGGQAKARWAGAIAIHDMAAARLEEEVSDAFASALGMCLDSGAADAPAAQSGQPAITPAQMDGCQAILAVAALWLDIGVEKVRQAILPYQKALIRAIEDSLTALHGEVTAGPPATASGITGRVRWLLALRAVLETQEARLPCIIVSVDHSVPDMESTDLDRSGSDDGYDEGRGAGAMQARPAGASWRRTDLGLRVASLVDELNRRIQPPAELQRWLDDVTAALDGAQRGLPVPPQLAGLSAALNVRQPLLQVRQASLRPEDTQNQPGTLYVQLPDRQAKPGAIPPRPGQAGATSSGTIAVAAITVAYSPLFESTCAEIRAVQQLLTDEGPSFPVECSVPTSLRSLALAEDGLRPNATALRRVLDDTTEAQAILAGAEGALAGAMSVAGVEVLAGRLTAGSRDLLHARLAGLCDSACTWQADGLEAATEGAVAACAAYLSLCRRLAKDCSALSAAMRDLTGTLAEPAAVDKALKAVGSVLVAIAEPEAVGTNRPVGYTADGLAGLDAAVAQATCDIVTVKVTSWLRAWKENEASRLVTRLVQRHGRVDCEPRLPGVRASLMDHLRAATDGFASLSCPSSRGPAKAVCYGQAVLKPSSVSDAVQACCGLIDESLDDAAGILESHRVHEQWWAVNVAAEAARMGTDLQAWLARVQELAAARDAVDEARMADTTGCTVAILVTLDHTDLLARVSSRLDSVCSEAVRRMAAVMAKEAGALCTAISATTSSLATALEAGRQSDLAFAEGVSSLHQALVKAYGSMDQAAQALGPKGSGDRDAQGWCAQVRLLLQCESSLERMSRDGMPQGWVGLLSQEGVGTAWKSLVGKLQAGLEALTGAQDSITHQRRLQSLDTGLGSSVTACARDWASKRPVSMGREGQAVTPSIAAQLCAETATQAETCKAQLASCARAMSCLTDILQCTGVGTGGVGMRPGGHDASVSKLLQDVVLIRELWDTIRAAWDDVERVQTTPWASSVPKTVRSLLDSCQTRLEAMPGHVQSFEVHSTMLAQVRMWRTAMPLVSELRAPSLQERHLAEVASALGLTLGVGASGEPSFGTVALGKVLDSDLLQHDKMVRELCRQAAGEAGIAAFLQELAAHWASTVWDTAPHRGGRTRVIRGWDVLLSSVDDHLASLSSLSASPFVGPFAREAAQWSGRLSSLRLLLDTWIDVQRAWLYLDGLLAVAPDIQQQLPAEAARLSQVDHELQGLMGLLAAAPQVLAAPCLLAGKPMPAVLRAGASCAALLGQPEGTLSSRLSSLADSLARVQAGLSQYLESRRSSFPRFFFLGDEDLLELLGTGGKEPAGVARHLPALFAGIASLEVEEGEGQVITAALSGEGERLELPGHGVMVRQDGSTPLHEWLGKVASGTATAIATGAAQCAAALGRVLVVGDGASVVGTTFVQWLTTVSGHPGARVPCEATLLGFAAAWTHAVETNLTARGHPMEVAEVVNALLQHVSAALTGGTAPPGRPGALAPATLSCRLSQRRAEQAITDIVHKRDVTSALVAYAGGGAGRASLGGSGGLLSPKHFEWRCRMRTYLTGGHTTSSAGVPSTVRISMGEAAFQHGLEYHGVGDRLVTTPLTDRAYLALTNALHLRLGGSPFGPAGTGKTETVKALGSALGRMVLVFNCDESFDFRAMGRLFSGLCRVGAWGCFDEFNRLEERVLSAISAQILAIQSALAGSLPSVDLLGRSVPLHSDVGIFVTMNPAYAGRSSLPDNLKALFRPVAMVAPDVSLIAAVTLFTQGFSTADGLARRVSQLFTSAPTTLSRQPHYDFGLRALKTVLVQAGKARRRLVKARMSQGHVSQAELRAVARCVVGNTVPRLVPSDLAPFNALLSSSFPEVGMDDLGSGLLARALAIVAERRGLVWRKDVTSGRAEQVDLGGIQAPVPSDPRTAASDIPTGISDEHEEDEGQAEAAYVLAEGNAWFVKAMQLATTAVARHGLMLLGPTGCGKSSAWRCLLEALALLDGVKGEATVIHPKALCPPPGTTGKLPALAKEQLYGRLDPATLEWRDGLFTSYLRDIVTDARAESTKRHWLVLDGDIDPEWAENLNSVLDDNKLLTLPSGERLALPPNVRIVFEVDSTRHATLATLSRAGMVCFPEACVTVGQHNRAFLAPLLAGVLQSLQGGHPRADVAAGLLAATGFNNPEDGSAGPTETAAAEESPLSSCLRLIGRALLEDMTSPDGQAVTAIGWAAAGAITTKGDSGKPITLAQASPIMPVDSVCLAQWVQALLGAGITRLAGLLQQGTLSPDEAVTRARQWLLVSLCWACGAAYNAPFRRALSHHALATFPQSAALPLPTAVRTAVTSANSSILTGAPSSCLLDFHFDLATGTWTPWGSLVPSLDLPPASVLDTNLVVPTVDTARHTDMLKAYLAARAPVILCGPPGSGKTMLLNAVLAADAAGPAPGQETSMGVLWPGGAHVAWLSLSSTTTPDYLLRVLEQYCEYKRTGDGWVLQPRRLGPDMSSGYSDSTDSWLVLFADEINLPAADKYGTARTIAFIRSLIECGGFWSPLRLAVSGQQAKGGAKGAEAPSGADTVWVSLRHVQLVGACNPPTDAGRVPLPSRLLRHAPVLYVGYPEPPVLHVIFRSLTRALAKLSPVLNVPGLADSLASACLQVYTANSSNFTAASAPQCVYSPRDMSRWLRALYEGLAPLAPGGPHHGAVPLTCELLVRLWFHEGLRLFHDRLPSQEDRTWCGQQMMDTAQQWFGKGSLQGNAAVDLTVALSGPVLFSDVLPASGGAVVPVDLPSLRSYLDGRAVSFSEETGSPRLVLFDEALEHILRIDRVLRQPLGHVLLAGASGTGKTLLPRFVAWLRGMSVLSVRLGPRYGLCDFDTDLRSAMSRAGVECEPLAFLFDEGSNLGSAFLERMNALLASGEVPGLFEGEDRAQLLQACRAAWPNTASAKGLDMDNDASILRRFSTNVQRHLHVVFAINPAAAEFSSRRATSPALFNRCVVDWLGEWGMGPRAQVAARVVAPIVDALVHAPVGKGKGASTSNGPGYTVPPALLQGETTDPTVQTLKLALNSAAAARLEQSGMGGPSISGSATTSDSGRYTYQDAIVAALATAHAAAEDAAADHAAGSGPRPFVSPRDFLDLLHHWSSLYGQRREDISAKHSTVQSGLQRIKATEAALATLKAGLAVKQKELAVKTDAANAKLAAMVSDQQEAESKRASSLSLRADLKVKTEAVAAREKQVAAQISAAEPALQDAQASVGAIGRRELDELRSMGSPPAPIKVCLEAVLVLMGWATVEDLDKGGGGLAWGDVRKVIKGGDFIASVVGARTENLSTQARRVVQERYVDGDKKNFTYERVNAASKACGPLYLWVTSQLTYATILEHVAPLKAEASSLAQEKEAVAGRADSVERTLRTLEASIARLKTEYAALIRDAEAVRAETVAVSTKVERASALVSSLARERARWETAAKGFLEYTAALPVDCILAAAYLTYCGWHDGSRRKSVESAWLANLQGLGLSVSTAVTSTGASVLDLLAAPSDRLSWHAMGLPHDDLAAGNGAILSHFRRFPLIVDPSPNGVAVGFVTRRLAQREQDRAGKAGAGSMLRGRASVGGVASRPAATHIARASMAEPTYLKTLESAVRFGTPLLLTDAEVLGHSCDTSLHALLEHGTGAAGGEGGAGDDAPVVARRHVVRIGDSDVEVSPSFVMYLVSRDVTVTYPPDTASRVTLVNFAVTPASLADALLAKILEARAPAVQSRRAALLSSRAAAESRLSSLEESLLAELAGGSGAKAHASLLEDDRLLEALEATKRESQALEADRDASTAVLEAVSRVSTAYQPVATAAAKAYLALAALPDAVCSLYRFSLGQFLEAFCSTLDHAVQEGTADSGQALDSAVPPVEEVLGVLRKALAGVRAFTCRGMYERHGHAWSLFMLRLAVSGIADVLAADAGLTGSLDSLLAGTAKASDRKAAGRLAAALGLSDASAALLAATADDLGSSWQRALATSLAAEGQAWTAFLGAAAASAGDMPTGWEVGRSEASLPATFLDALRWMRRLVVLRAVRPDLLTGCIQAACVSLMPASKGSRKSGQDEVASTITSVASSSTPVLLLCTPGADADMSVHHAAGTTGMGPGQVCHVAMGSADSITSAEAAVAQAAAQGGWVVLYNVHLAAEWAAGLVKSIQTARHGAGATPGHSAPGPAKMSDSFRLILTAEVPPMTREGGTFAVLTQMPVSLLLTCQKVVLETPAGARAGFTRTLASIPQTRAAASPALVRASAYVRLAWLHTLVLERRRYVPHSWSKAYDHGDADFAAGLDTIDVLLAYHGQGASLATLLPEMRTMVTQAVHGARLETPGDDDHMYRLARHVMGVTKPGTPLPLGMDGSLAVDIEAQLQGTPGRGVEGMVAWAGAHLPARLSPTILGLPGDADAELESTAAAVLLATVQRLLAVSVNQA